MEHVEWVATEAAAGRFLKSKQDAYLAGFKKARDLADANAARYFLATEPEPGAWAEQEIGVREAIRKLDE